MDARHSCVHHESALLEHLLSMGTFSIQNVLRMTADVLADEVESAELSDEATASTLSVYRGYGSGIRVLSYTSCGIEDIAAPAWLIQHAGVLAAR